MEQIEKGKKYKKIILRVVRITLVLAVIIGGIGWLQYSRNREFKGYEVTSEAGMYTNLSGYTAGNGRLFLYSNDGARALNGAGEPLWEISYQLDNPAIVYCQEVAAVADIGGKSVYVVAENGIPHNYEVIYPIVKHEVAKQGVTAVLLDNGMEDFIQLYDMNGLLRVDINTKTKIDGIPVDIALSPDGKKLVTLYVTFQGEAMLCKATFYNADEVGKNYNNNIVGQKTFAENLLAYDICFLNEDTVCVLLENGFALYRMTEKPELICEKTFPEAAEEIICVNGGFYVVKETAAKQKALDFYNEAGEIKQSWKEIPEYEAITATKDEVVFFSPQRVTIYRVNGSLKFSTAFAQSLEAVFPSENNQYFLVDTGRVQTIKLSDETKNESEENER